MFKANGLDAVLLTHTIDTHFISFLEYKESGTKLARIDSELGDALKSDEVTDDASNEKLKEIFKTALGDDKLEIQTEGLKAKETPAILLQNEYMRRMNDMNTLYGGIFGGSPEAKETLVINTTNDIIKTLPTLSEENRTLVCKHILDLATISQRKLTADELKDFVARSVEILGIIK